MLAGVVQDRTALLSARVPERLVGDPGVVLGVTADDDDDGVLSPAAF